MKIFSITMVKNEIDIIETFVRYHAQLLDGMVILDNGSTDRTVGVINKLINEGLPISLLFDDNPSYDQSSIMTSMLYSTLKQFKPDYVLPLDVDEFLITSKDESVRSVLNKQLKQNSLFFLRLLTYVPTESDYSAEANPLKRIIHRRDMQYNYDEKVLIPASIALAHGVTITQGNHDIEGVPDDAVDKTHLEELSLAHFPIRSKEQFESKILVGWFANLARDNQVLFNWHHYYNILKDGKSLMSRDLYELALRYDVSNKRVNIGIVKDPISLSRMKDFVLQYTPKERMNYFKNVLNYAETLAKKYSKLRKKTSGKNNEGDAYNDQMILQVIRDYLLIDGWLRPREAIALFKLVQSVESSDVTVCEIGSWLGKSSYVLSRALDTKKNGRLYCIDPFDASGDKSSATIYKSVIENLGTSLLLDKFEENMRKFGVRDRIMVLQGYSHDVIRDFDKPIDILFIDGNHDYESVSRDYNDWSKLIKKGGFIAFHDSHMTGPKQVIELEIVRNPIWGNQQLVDELYIAQKME